MKYILLITAILSISLNTSAQEQDQLLRDGNAAYREQQYEKASELFRRSTKAQGHYSFQASYNLGNAYYKNGEFQQARAQYQSLLSDTLSQAIQSQLHYNIGNTWLQEKQWEQGIQSYKNALRLNPSDEDARYNLAYALQMLKQQQKNNDKKNDQDKENNKQDQNKDQQDKENQQSDQNKDDQKSNNQQEQKNSSQNPDEIDQAEADKILKALRNKEKETLREVHSRAGKGQTSGIKRKDW